MLHESHDDAASAVTAMVATRVLIVEDDPTFACFLGSLLDRYGYETTAVDTLAGAFDALTLQPSSILLDLVLADGLGTPLLEHIRRNKLPIRVAVVTAAEREDLLRPVRLLKPDALFIKPVGLKALVDWLSW